MGYKNLKNFQNIFNRADFNYISNLQTIERIGEIITISISARDKRESEHVKELKDYITNLNSFYQSIAAANVPNLNEGYNLIVEELQKVIRLFSEIIFKRESISKGHLRKMKKTFLYGLSRLLDGIRAAFDPDIISSTRIDNQQFIKFILDDTEGIGKYFTFNEVGKDSFIKKLPTLNQQELIVTARLLTRPSANQVRTINGWRDLGLAHAPVRILSKPAKFGKARVYYLYRSNEHTQYQSKLDASPERAIFRAAA